MVWSLNFLFDTRLVFRSLTMDIPQPPDDLELKTIIDKLANFVARNGMDFEQMTKNKQRDNPKFSFLYGGEHFNYYQFKVTTEQAIINQQKQKVVVAHAQQTLNDSASPWKQNEAILLQIVSLQDEIMLEEMNVQTQVTQSEQNLNAQYASLTQTQQYQVDDLVTKMRKERVDKLSIQSGLSVADFDSILQPIIESCTKDAISNGKNWIFNRANSYLHFDFIASHLLNRILERETAFEVRLHLIYLINDLLHHSQRKGIDQMKMNLAKIVVPAFSTATSGVDEVKRQKLDKLLILWRKNSYFDAASIEKMRDPISALADYQASCVSEHSALISSIAATIQQQYSALQIQHKEYSEHLMVQLQQRKDQLEQMRTQQQALATIVAANTINTSIPPPGLMSVPPLLDPQQSTQFPPPFMPTASLQFDPTRPPPSFAADGGAPPMIPDLSRPPPGFPEPMRPTPPPPQKVNLMPSVPYYDLPAGLMCPLVKLEDHEYKPLDSSKIRLPPPAPPTDKLLAAVEAFYSAPSHESPRDGKGWERLGLYEYYKDKDAARKKKLDERGDRSGSESRSPSRSSSRSKSASRSMSRSRSKSPRHKHSTSRSPSPERHHSPRHHPPHHHSPYRRSRSPSPDRPYQQSLPMNPNERISEQNKGHMLMRKMGWGGRGLGASEQGMLDPIQGAEARDKIDQFKGIGMDVQDPFEQFRKKNSSGFIQKLRTREEERKVVRPVGTDEDAPAKN